MIQRGAILDKENKKDDVNDIGTGTEETADESEMSVEKKRRNDSAEAAEYLNGLRELAGDPDNVGQSHPHEEKDTSYMDEKKKGISVFSIIKYVFYGLVIFVFLLVFYRIYMQNDSNFEFSEMFVWTDEAIEAYEEKGSLTVYTQDMGRIGNLILIDEADETVSYDYTYSPYSESDDVRGCFMTSNIMYIEETQQLIFTFRVNKSASEAVMNKYSLESKPGKDSYSFVLSDGENYYTEYDYLTASRGTYFYYRVVFTGVEYTHVDKPYNSPLSGVTELSLSVYYDDLKNFDSPLDTMTLANNLLSAEKFELKKALPAEKPDGLMSYVSFELD